MDAKPVEYQHLGVVDLLEQIGVGDFAAGGVGGAQIVQQIRHMDEESELAQLDAAVGDGGGEMRLAATVGAGQGEPTDGVVRVLARRSVGGGEQADVFGGRIKPVRVGGFKRHARQGAEVGVAAQPRFALAVGYVYLAAAGDRLAEVGVSDGDVHRQPLAPFADAAVVFRARVAVFGRAVSDGEIRIRHGRPRSAQPS